MIAEVQAVPIKKMERISPSQFYTATQCPYKMVLANSYGFKQMMPLSPNAYLGSVLHKIIEMISKGIINDDNSFEFHWRKEIELKETVLKKDGMSGITPLKYFVDDFALKKIKTRNLIKNRANAQTGRGFSKKKYLPEEPLCNDDRTISGVVDLIIEDEGFIAIIDFKTGGVFDAIPNDDGEPTVKKDYEYQLKLYCYLYYLKNNLLPSKLYIATLENAYVEVLFTLEGCKAVYEEATEFLAGINKIIERGEYSALAHCNTDNCRFCPYRPACQYYTTWLDNHFEETKDLKGKLLKVNIFGNNTVGIELEVAGKTVLVNGFNPGSYQKMEKNIGMELRLYNLKKNKNSLNATVNHYTVVYA